MRRFSRLVLALPLLALALVPASAAEFNDAQKAEIQAIVKDYLVKNPEILRDMAQALQEADRVAEDKQRGETLTAHKDAMFNDAGDFVAGNPKGKVTLVEFFDYNCGYCKKSFPAVLSLAEKDKDLRIVLKELPIFGGDSDYAAKAAVAAHMQGKYWELHQALFKHEGKVTAEVVDAAAKDAGMDVAKMKADMAGEAVQAKLAKNEELARAMAFTGTPAFVVDDVVIPGAVPLEALEQTLKDVRDRGCKYC